MHGVTLLPLRFGDRAGKRSQDITGSGSSVPGSMATTPCSIFLSACACIFFFERPTLRVGHSALGCNNRKANATLTTVRLHNNKIGDRGAVALAGAVQALLATVFFVPSTQSVLAVWS